MEDNKGNAQETKPIVVPAKDPEPDGNAAKTETSDAKPETKQV